MRYNFVWNHHSNQSHTFSNCFVEINVFLLKIKSLFCLLTKYIIWSICMDSKEIWLPLQNLKLYEWGLTFFFGRFGSPFFDAINCKLYWTKFWHLYRGKNWDGLGWVELEEGAVCNFNEIDSRQVAIPTQHGLRSLWCKLINQSIFLR